MLRLDSAVGVGLAHAVGFGVGFEVGSMQSLTEALEDGVSFVVSVDGVEV